MSASTFSAVSQGGQLLLAFGGSTNWSADNTPSGSDQETLYAGADHDATTTLAIVSS